MTDSTPLNADDELRQHCDSLGVPSLWYDKLIEIVEADRNKQVEAVLDRIDYHTSRTYPEHDDIMDAIEAERARLKERDDETI